ERRRRARRPGWPRSCRVESADSQAEHQPPVGLQPPLAWVAVIERLAGLEDEYRAIEARLADPAVVSDLSQLRDLNRRYKELGAVVSAYREYRRREDDLTTAKQLLVEAAGDERELARIEVVEAEADLARLEDELKVLLLPRDPNAGKAV